MYSSTNIKIFFIAFISLFAKMNFSQNTDPRFVKLPLDKGISLNLTYDMIQDTRGFLWFGTMYGLVRYDGENFVNYKYDPKDTTSISYDDIISLFEDSKGNIWIGTWGGGLNVYDFESETFNRFEYNPTDSTSISYNIIWSFCEDNKGNIWIGTDAAGLLRYEPNSGLFTKIDLGLDDSIGTNPSIQTMILIDDILWIGHSRGLTIYNPTTNKVQSTFANDKIKSLLSNAYVNSIYKDSNSNIWIGTFSGLYKYSNDDKAIMKVPLKENLSITSIVETTPGDLWFGTNNGLMRLNPSTYKYNFFNSENNSIAGNFVNKILVDQSGIIWTSSYNSEVTKCLLLPSKFHTVENIFDESSDFKNSIIRTIAEDEKGNIYLGSFDKKIVVLDKYGKIINSIHLPEKNYSMINALAVNKGLLWIGTNNSLLTYDLNKKQISENLFSNGEYNQLRGKQITEIKFDQRGNLWIGTYNQGVYYHEIDSKMLTYYSLRNDKAGNQANYILTIFPDSQDRIWIGTYGGVYLLNSQSGEFISYIQEKNNLKSLSNNYVYSIQEDINGNLWFGTASGLNRFDPNTNTFKYYFQKDGLPSDVIFGIVSGSNGDFWLSTNKGLSRFNSEKETFLNFDENDGLQGNIFNPGANLVSSNGTIYFGGIQGLNYFNPEEWKFSKFNPPVVITSIRVRSSEGNTHQVNPQNDKFELEPEQNSLFIEFASLDYTNPDLNKYQYKLVGLSDDWVSINTENSVAFSKLPPGNYSFYLKGTNSDGIWSENVATLSFVIHPFFWQMWWFLPIVLLGLILVSFLTHLSIVKSKVKRAIKIEKIKEEEGERIRKKTAIDFHDELGHRLTRISLLTEIVKRKIGDAYQEIKPLLDQISENSSRLYDGTKDFIWAIDPQKDTLYELVIRLKDFGDDIFGSTNVNFSVDGITDDLQKASLDMDWKRHLMLIFKEGMNNSLKHSKSKKVSLTSNLVENGFELILEDDGIGFETEKISRGNGLRNMERRAETLDSFIQIDSQPGFGTKLSFKGKFHVKSVNYN